MMKQRSWTSFWKILYHIGMFVVWFVNFNLIKDIQPQFQWALALASALVWLASSILLSEIQNLPEELKEFRIRWRWVGIANLFLAILFLTVIKSSSNYEMWAWGINLMFGSFSVITAYITVVAYLFPAIFQETTPPPNPLDTLPTATRNVIEKGLKWSTFAIIIPIFGFFLIGAVGFFISTFYLHKENTNFFLICMGLGFLIGFPLGFATIYKWQKWARESGIPEEELKAAAKLAGLWWPKTKRPA